jgi:prepilin-type N-terminal cleavage/methylation domain-containing protein
MTVRRISWRAAARLLDNESGFTIIELVMASVVLAIISAPVAGVLLAAAAQSKTAREETAANQLLSTKLETIRTLAYASVGIAGGNPSGVLDDSVATSLSNGESVTIATKVSYVNDPIPTAYVTNADYKKVVLTITRASDGRKLAAATTYVASASAPPLSGTGWVQIKRQIVDAVTAAPLPNAQVEVVGGPNAEDRTDVADGSGTVLFPALGSASSGTPVYTLTTALSGYSVFPDDLPTQTPEQVGSSPGLNSVGTVRMYQNGVSVTVNVQNSSGAAYTSGATITIQSSRCGVATLTIPSGQSSATVTTCQWANGKTISLVPNVPGQVPSFDKYGVTAWTSGGLFGSATQFTLPSNYPSTLTQTATVKLSSSSFTTKTVTVTVTKGGVIDKNARVLLTGGPASAPLFLYGTTNSSGQASFTIPVTSTSSTYTVAANDQGAAQGTLNFTATTSTSSPISQTVAIS